MAHLSLYRKWRPQRFQDVVGQEAVVQTLRNALRLGRFAHAYLFSGPRGTGKTTLARLLSKGLNCRQGPTGDPCGTCPSCQRISEGRSLDVIEIDGASNRGIDEVRELRESARFAPAESRFKVYIIDEVHMLTHEAFNALLKLLEEPPAHVVFLFATTEPHRLPATIISRCQRFDLHRLSETQLRGRLAEVAAAEGIALEEEALRLVTRMSQGALRDGLSLLDQVSSLGDGPIRGDQVRELLGLVPEDRVDGLLEALAAASPGASLEWLARLEADGVDFRQLARAVVERVRDLLVVLTVGDPAELLGLDPGTDGPRLSRSRELAERLGWERLEQVAQLFTRAEGELRRGEPPRLTLELASLEVLRSASLEERIRRVEARLDARGSQGAGTERAPFGRPAAAPEAVPSGQAREAEPVEPARPPEHVQRTEAIGSRTEPAPDPAPPVRTGPEQAHQDLAALWEAVLAELSRSAAGRATHAFAREARLAHVSGDQAVLVFPAGYAFHRSNLEQKAHRERVQRLLGRQLGRLVQVRVASEDEVQEPAQEPPAPAPVLAGSDPLRPDAGGRDAEPEPGEPVIEGPVEIEAVQDPVVRKAVEFFGGHVVRIERKG
ncbi:DNA polymerase III subunit gamma/tau [Limnochorda pilosa]|uniref:DNA-directed DNA polymerase n=1 Tax=Limnochorda pilosa TaxID=1555112 RepID=A0A0K2SPJ1_LIMPI|nr:DNA polymerase III subunit gamma/tau [Limnochorda pilosa]BAS29021.1 DNA polymerase III subunit gamma/tau [Limnochorda pilosa]